jgi:hypothetical protein
MLVSFARQKPTLNYATGTSLFGRQLMEAHRPRLGLRDPRAVLPAQAECSQASDALAFGRPSGQESSSGLVPVYAVGIGEVEASLRQSERAARLRRPSRELKS